jgi:phosphate acyltransferase
MGGDAAPRVVVEAALQAHRQGLPVVLVGREAELSTLLPRGSGVRVVHAPDVVSNEEKAASGVRRKPGASVRVTMAEVASGRASAAVSCGNTGAAVVSAFIEVGMLDGVERPAVATVLPRADGGRLVLLDAGANVDCKPALLAHFAQLGVAYASALGVDDPRVGLLCNGTEETKGNALVREALPLIQALPVRSVGYVEPPAAMAGGCDVLVCDGFVGNILLKAAEGAVATAVRLLREEIGRRPGGLLGAWLLRGALNRFRRRVAWDAHGGGLLLGTRAPIVIGHGRANAGAVLAAIQMADGAVRADTVGAVQRALRGPSAPGS